MEDESRMVSTLGRRGRMSVKRKQETAIRLLRRADLERVSRDLRVTGSNLSMWWEAFLRGGASALKSRSEDEKDEQIQRLEGKPGR